MSSRKSGLSGRYELIPLELKDGTNVGKRTLVVQGAFETMCSFYVALKDAMESSINADIRQNGFTDHDGVNVGYEADDLMNWRTDPKELAAYDLAKASAKRDGFLRFAAEESRFSYPRDPWSWVAALESAIQSTGIAMESEALVV